MWLGGYKMKFFWNFFFYSFLGFGLEVVYAYLTGGRKDRKRTLLLPLCPVYGVGAAAILFFAPVTGGNKVGTFLLGGVTATAVEVPQTLTIIPGRRGRFRATRCLRNVGRCTL